MFSKSLPKIFLLAVGALSAAAQSSQPTPEATDLSDPNSPRSTVIRERGLGMDMLPYELTRSVGKLVSVTEAEKARYGQLRKAAGMKFLKVFSAPRCASEKLVIDVSMDECTAAVDLIRASFYSFRFSLYGETIVDFRILEDRMIVGNGGFVHGMVLDLGKEDVIGFTQNAEAAKSFFEMPIATTLEEESRQRIDLASGVPFNGKTVSSSMKLTDGNVYLVRIVSYNFKKGDRSTFDRDQLYLLKYLGMSSEKIALILWKKLGDRPAPKL